MSLTSGPMSLSIVVPSYNEEVNLEATINNVSAVLKDVLDDFEFVIVNDCSKDRTGEVADRIARTNPRVRVFHNPVNLGLGGSYRKGISLAQKEYVILVPGDNELKPDSVRYIWGFAGKADIIVPFPENIEIRPWYRQVVSHTFTAILNWISGYQIKYYNGSVLIRKSVLDRITFDTNGFAFQAEILVQLIRGGFSYHQIPFQLNYGSTRMTAFRPKNLISVSYTVLRMAFEYRIFSFFLNNKRA